MTKRLFATALVAALSLALGASFTFAEDQKQVEKTELKSVSGTSACAMCEGLPVADHAILIKAKDGTRWVLLGDDKVEGYKKAFEARMDGKQMSATLASAPETKKDNDGKEFKQAKISQIKVKES